MTARDTRVAETLRLSPAFPRYETVKRILDVMIAVSALVTLSLFLLGIALLIRLTSPGPSLYRQTRVGRNGREFQILKFRSMHNNVDDRVHRQMNIRELQGDRLPPGTKDGLFKLEDDPRVTKVGRWLRRYGLDELPQLINVLLGEMSIVGPRPSLPWEVELYTPEQRRRHDCQPGITGLWQISDRYYLSMPEMLELDLQYVRSMSLKLDLWILLRTPRAVLRSSKQ